MLRRLAALLSLLVLLAPAWPVLASGTTCADGCCAGEPCADAPSSREADEAQAPSPDASPADSDCPPGCPDCACNARVAAPLLEARHVPPCAVLIATMHEPVRPSPDADPREILHVPLG